MSAFRALVRLNVDLDDWDEFEARLESLIGQYDENATYSKVIVSDNGRQLAIYENKNETNIAGYFKSDDDVDESRLG
jgi:hypothetical protein